MTGNRRPIRAAVRRPALRALLALASMTAGVEITAAPVAAATNATLEVDVAEVTEGDTVDTLVLFTVRLDAPADGDESITVSTIGQTATLGVDVTNFATGGTFLFPQGATEMSFTHFVVGDTLAEEDETFTFVVVGKSGLQFEQNQVTVTIIDDDDAAPAAFSLSGPTAPAAESSQLTTMTFTLTSPTPTPAPCQLTVFDAGTGTDAATLGSDFFPDNNGLVEVSAGTTTTTILIGVIDDTDVEGNETVTIRVGPNPNALKPQCGLGTVTTASGTITDNDAPPPPPTRIVSVGDASINEGKSGTRNLVFTLRLDGPAVGGESVVVATADVSASSSSDYQAVPPTTITFAAGETIKTVTVKVRGDTTVESDETLTLTLSAPVNLTIGDATGVGTIRNDDSTGGGGGGNPPACSMPQPPPGSPCPPPRGNK